MTREMATLLAEAIETARELTEPAMRKALTRLDPVMQQICSYHVGWSDISGAPASGSTGKALRPTLVLLSARACDGEPGQAVPAAVAVELVHNFSLLHDDVMDGDEQRRHRPTAWSAFGVPAAVLAGDALLCLAVDVVLRAPDACATSVAASVVGATGELIAGQSADLDFERRTDVSLTDGLAMAYGKTAALLRCAASVGAQAVQAPSPRSTC